MLQFAANIAGLFTATYRVKELHHHGLTGQEQQATVFTRNDGVKMFFIDDEEQSSTEYMDDFNRSLIPPHVNLGKVLILGAGAGGPAKWALRTGTVSHITQVDIDLEIVEIAKRYLIEWHEGEVFRNPQVTTLIEDARDYVNRARLFGHGQFDTIIFDLTEVTDLSAELWNQEFFEKVLTLLRPGGNFASHLTWIGNDAEERADKLFKDLPLTEREVVSVTEARWSFFYAKKA